MERGGLPVSVVGKGIAEVKLKGETVNTSHRSKPQTVRMKFLINDHFGPTQGATSSNCSSGSHATSASSQD